MAISTAVVGTKATNTDGSSRDKIIRGNCKTGNKIQCRRDSNDSNGPNTVAVFLLVKKLFGLLGSAYQQIGYLKPDIEEAIAKRLDAGEVVEGRITNYFTPLCQEPARVDIELQ